VEGSPLAKNAQRIKPLEKILNERKPQDLKFSKFAKQKLSKIKFRRFSKLKFPKVALLATFTRFSKFELSKSSSLATLMANVIK
jgi:hypothetical protein